MEKKETLSSIGTGKGVISPNTNKILDDVVMISKQLIKISFLLSVTLTIIIVFILNGIILFKTERLLEKQVLPYVINVPQNQSELALYQKVLEVERRLGLIERNLIKKGLKNGHR